MDSLMESLERRLQRPLLAKSRTLPSIPQSPTVGRMQQHSQIIGGSPPYPRLPSSPTHLNAPTLPPAGDAWRLEDDKEVEPQATGPSGVEPRPRSQSPFSHFRIRAAYLRKSVSVDDELDVSDYDPTRSEGRSSRSDKGKLKRKFSLGSADRKEARQRRLDSGIVRLTQRLSLKDRQWKQDKSLPCTTPAYRRRSLSLDGAECKMTQQVSELRRPAMRKCSSVSSSSPPSAARRLYRNLSGKFRTNPGLDTTTATGCSDREHIRKATALQGNGVVFEAVEQQDLELVQTLLKEFSPEDLDLNTPNSEGLLPLDIAILTNNVPMAKILLQSGAKESPHFVSPESRALHLAALVQEAELRVSELVAQVTGVGPVEREESDRERQLKAWEWRLRLYKRMQTGYTHASPPDPPSEVCVCVSGSSSLTVHFQEPICLNSAVVTKYRVMWSGSQCFTPPLGEMVIEDTSQLQCDITGLTTGVPYYIQVFAYNMKGWSSPQISVPACAIPSNWRDVDGRTLRLQGLQEALHQILEQIKEAHQDCTCHDQCKGLPNVRKYSVSKSLRHLFQPNSKFIKTLKRGMYVACVFYRDDSVLVTAEEQLPIVEVDNSYSSLTQDFLWFTKVSYLWEEVSWLLQCVSPAQLSCSCTLQIRLKMLQALVQLQGMLATQDLGQVYFEPIKDKHGNALLVLLKEVVGCALEGLHWTPLSKLQIQRKSISSPEEPTALDTLLITLHEKLSFHRRSRKVLTPGLYLGYVKLCSSVEQIRVLVPHKIPNIFCHVKIRDNSHVSREEWQWLQSVRSLEDTEVVCADEQSAPQRLLLELRNAAKELLGRINISNNQAQDFRLYVQEVVEFGEGVSFLLLLPPCEEVCTPPGQNNPFSPRSGFFTLPLQIFELVHFEAYCPRFIRQYCRASAVLGLESLMSQQALREAFSESELLTAKEKHHRIQELLQHMEEVWREARWMVEVLQCARYKQQPAGVSLSSIIDFTKEAVPEKTPSTSSQPDYLPSPVPSPVPSPHTSRKHSALSDDEGSLEVFLTTDSDYDSSRAQSPRELDLLPPVSPSHTHTYTRTPSFTRTPPHTDPCQPDVLQTGGGIRGVGLEMIDSDFVLPSRQIQLLRITEKKTALCVRTSSLEYPPPISTATVSTSLSPQRLRTRPASVDRCCPTPESRPRPVRTLSEDSGMLGMSVHSPSSAHQFCYTTLRVYPQYRTGLPKETSVKLRVTMHTSAREMVQLVVQEINGVCSRLQTAAGQCVCRLESCVYPAQACVCGAEVCVYGVEQMEHFGLVLVMNDREKWLQDDFCPLTLQNPWTRGKLCVRFKQYSPLALQFSRATTV
ncbi:ankyrin repeat and fibronectin type-III domain-containing protein 1 isoform X2 [Salminus brasiliensis]|uniref:ankyrin repeat and fibronectin type-III domain-containing protein 1 isoform X2 n=1 Tax=Salminus brasiliensis TaxID=930266 RepID=UPI003B83754B